MTNTVPLICRLCMNNKSLTSIFKMDDDISLSIKTINCTQLKIFPGDGLPSVICNKCEKVVNEFYEFKQKCLAIDLKIRNMIDNFHTTPPPKIDSMVQTFESDFKQESGMVDMWLRNDTKSDLHECLDTLIIDDCFTNNTDMPMKQTDLCNAQQMYTNPRKYYKIHKLFLCENCGRFIKTRAAFERHISSHFGIKLFSCKICTKRFTRLEHKVVHMRSHLGIRPYICDVCGCSSTKRQDLVRHMKIHSDEKKYACPRCDKQFKRSSDVHTHIRTHTGLRPYVCKVCKKDYTSHSGMRKHYNAHCK